MGLTNAEQIFLRATLAVIVAITLLVGSSCAHSKFAIQKIIESGVDPIIARCSIGVIDSTNRTICILAITQQKEQ